MSRFSASLAKALTVGAIAALSAAAIAQPSYPSKPIRFIVPYTGGSSDVTARILAPKLQEALHQPVIVENRPGANAMIGSELVAKSAPDGYTLLVIITTHVISPNLIKAPYDPVKDFAPVATFGAAELGMALNLAVPANNLQEFIALARSKPGELNYATTQIGGNQHLAGELFNILTGAKMTAIPYKGGADALSAVMGGHAQIYIGSLASLIPVIRAGKLKGIAVSGENRTPALPQVPTFTQAGVANFDVRLWYGFLAPAGTPRDIVDKLNTQINTILATQDFKDALAKQGMDPLISTPEQFGALMRTDYARYANVIKTANIKVEN